MRRPVLFASVPDCEIVCTHNEIAGYTQRLWVGEDTNGRWRVYKDENTWTWEVTGERFWKSRDEAIGFIEKNGWRVEIIR